MNEKIKLLAATKNSGKVREIGEILANFPLELENLNAFPSVTEPAETGATFAENAALKARYYALQTGWWSLADDSGLEVEALDGAPGIFSARYAGADASDSERIVKLLEEINSSGSSNRRARFSCAMAVADEKGLIKFTAEGFCDGIIASGVRGGGGFGYDPIFIPDGFDATFGELPSEVKRKISHRKQAIDKIIEQLRLFYAAPT